MLVLQVKPAIQDRIAAPLIMPAGYVSTVDMLLCIVVWCDENVGALLPCMHALVMLDM